MNSGRTRILDDGDMRATSVLLEVQGLQASYGMGQVLFDVDLCVEAGEVVALLGRNGAGKSTTLKAIMGMVAQVSGRILLDGRDLTGEPPHRIARAGIGYVPQDRRVFPDLTVDENLEVGRRTAPEAADAWTLERVYALFPALGRLRHRRGDTLSGGEQQMLAIARSLVGNPRVLLLDEPSEGLAPLVVRSLADQVGQLKKRGVAVLLSEQNVRFTTLVCDRAYLLERGHIRHHTRMDDLSKDARLLGKYLNV